MQAALRNTSPVNRCAWVCSISAVSAQRTPSEARPLVSLPARSRRLRVRSACSFSSFCSCCAWCSCCFRASTLSSTLRSAACFSDSLRLASASCASAWLNLARFGPTTLETLLYTSMACVHIHRLMAALDCLATFSGVYCGSSMYFRSFLATKSGMLSLSKSSKLRMKPESLRMRLAVSQSGFSCFRMHTASMVICTSDGGFANDLISVMSFLLRDLSESMAAHSAGMASSRSALASSATT
mmetsp:Transcript_10035/g.27351  ORF Transcript_10035/g.27351 Transcript_10035/m.27351 type:complete len:241 (-) Transcript_10035:5495-6217(-)